MNKFKEYKRQITPDFIRKLLKRLRQPTKPLKRVLRPKGAINLRNVNFIKKHDEVIVLGNGPSLKNDLDDIAKKTDTHDFVCVNNFCSSPYYKVFKPSIYVFLDPYFFSENSHESWIVQREKTFKIINEQTTWNMKIFLPFGANEKILKRFIINEKIDIIKMNVSHSNNIKLYDSGYFGPIQCNVLIYAVYLAIWSKYKNIKIYGADMSFHKDIDVDQNDNSLFMTFKHFNSEDTIEKLMKNPEKIIPTTMKEELTGCTYIFEAHEILNSYANKHNIEISNYSSYSLIDAYKRPIKLC